MTPTITIIIIIIIVIIYSIPTFSFGRAKSMSELQNPEINGLANQEERSLSTAPPSFLFRSEFGDITGKNWSYLTNEVL